MRTWRLGLVGLVAGLFLMGCSSTVDEGDKEFKPTDTKQFEQMKEQMLQKFKTKSLQKLEPPKTSPSK